MFEFNTVEEAVKDLKEGKIIIVTDDDDRENEGDFICAAEYAVGQPTGFSANGATRAEDGSVVIDFSN